MELIKIVGPEGNQWFKADDVCKALGYIHTKDALKRHVKRPQDKKQLNELATQFAIKGTFRRDREGQQPYITKHAFELLVSKCKNVAAVPVIPYLIERYKLNMRIVDYTKEQIHINSIVKVFGHERHETQFNIGSYRIDLYFIDKKIAVECDEHGHSGRKQSEEHARQKYIEDVLGCKFIRFNPDSKDFDIFNVLNQIVLAMY